MLLMAQQRNCVVYEETADSHLKLVGKLFDQVWMIVLNANLNNKITVGNCTTILICCYIITVSGYIGTVWKLFSVQSFG